MKELNGCTLRFETGNGLLLRAVAALPLPDRKEKRIIRGSWVNDSTTALESLLQQMANVIQTETEAAERCKRERTVAAAEVLQLRTDIETKNGELAAMPAESDSQVRTLLAANRSLKGDMHRLKAKMLAVHAATDQLIEAVGEPD